MIFIKYYLIPSYYFLLAFASENATVESVDVYNLTKIGIDQMNVNEIANGVANETVIQTKDTTTPFLNIFNTTTSTTKKTKHKFNETESLLKPKFITPCTTPNQDNGYCMPIKSCSVLLRQLNNTKARDFIRESSCGPRNQNVHNPKVCCGKYGNFHKPSKDPLPKRCGIQKFVHRNRIYGGVEANLGEFPWMARLVHRSKGGIRSFGCGGFLIHKKFVLTAAHCLKSDNAKLRGDLISVVLGEHNIETEIDCDKGEVHCADPIKNIRVKESIVHNKYNESSQSFQYDIALIELKKSVHFTDYVQPLCIAKEWHSEKRYFISGWGLTEDETSSSVKLKVDIPHYDYEECKERYGSIDVEITESQICAGGVENKDSCAGDSGGPLMVPINLTHWYAAGIVSFGYGCGTKNWPGVYTNLTHYYNWTVKEIESRL